MLYTRILNTDQPTETVVGLHALSDMFKVICYARVWRNNRLYTISRLLPAVAGVVIIILNVRCWSWARLCCV